MPRARQAPARWNAAVLDRWRMRQDWVLAQQIAIAETPAPTGAEAERAALMLRGLASAGCESLRRDDTGNIIARIAPRHLRASAPPLVCLAHLDTVFASDTELRVTRTGSQLRCPGIGDNSRGLAAMLSVADALHAPEIHNLLQRPVEIVATVGEEGEGNLRGARAYFGEAAAQGRSTFAAIAVDGPGDRAIVRHAVGSCRVRIHLHGQGGHSWANAATANPVHAAGALIAALAQLSARERPHAVITVSRMHGGELLTSIPRDAWVDVDIRAIDSARLARLQQAILPLAIRIAATESSSRPNDALAVRAELLGERPAGQLNETHPLVHEAIRATERAGRTPQAASASTDANIPLALGIPAIAIGAGGTGGNAHSHDEWFDDDDSSVGLLRLIDLVTTIACGPTW